ncbi:hypothetical protein QFZ68_007303 [Streptomyces sp. V1I6]|nr:hypothetical protein [Streptomyces sp. V1I6]
MRHPLSFLGSSLTGPDKEHAETSMLALHLPADLVEPAHVWPTILIEIRLCAVTVTLVTGVRPWFTTVTPSRLSPLSFCAPAE